MSAVLDTILAECEKAIIARKPIIWIRTDELELIHRIIASDRLVARVFKNKDQIAADLLYKDAADFLEGQYLFGDSHSYQNNIRNVLTFPSVDLFAKCISKKTTDDYGVPHASDAKSVYPNLFVICGDQREGRALEKIESAYLDVRSYIDRYIMEKDDNTTVASSTVLFYGEQCTLPEYLQGYCAIVDEPFPEQAEIQMVVQKILKQENLLPLDEGAAARVASYLSGFRLLEVERLMAFFLRYPQGENEPPIIYSDSEIDDGKTINIKKLITEEKKQMLKKDQVLELVSTKNSDNARIGGMEGFKIWLAEQMPSVCHSQRFILESGGRPCKGVLMCGIPGCGKSLAAQQVAAQTKLPLLRLEIGKLMGKFVGESEHNMDKAIKQAEAMAPCVLWIDEIEKGFGNGGDNGSQGSDPTRRMFGSLLTWLQECKAPVFVFATANSITGMPKEFFRSGRFDALYALYMPTYEECVDILKNQMERVNERVRESVGKAVFEEADKTEKWKRTVSSLFWEIQDGHYRYMTGADIEKIVNMALRQLWKDQELTYPIDIKTAWKPALKKALESTRVYGDGHENLDSIAICYIRMLNNNFTPTVIHPLFKEDDYVVTYQDSGKVTVKIAELTQERSERFTEYDRSMRVRIAERMRELGPTLEESSLRRLIG